VAISTIDRTQRRAATVVGFAYLLAIPPALFAEIYLSHLIVDGSVAETARNIMAHERLFRLCTASNLSVFALDVVLITALYVVLEPVNRTVAMLAAFWGLVETSVMVVAALNDLAVLRLLSGADYLRVFEAERLQALARLSLGAHGAAYGVGLVFAGLRSTAFCYLWLRSDYVPKSLAGWGVLSSLLLATCTFAFIIFPELAKIVTVSYYGGPIFIFELAMGSWLLFKGLPPSGKGESDGASDEPQTGAA